MRLFFSEVQEVTTVVVPLPGLLPVFDLSVKPIATPLVTVTVRLSAAGYGRLFVLLLFEPTLI